MADCSAAGTALDRISRGADPATSSAARAISSFLTGTASHHQMDATRGAMIPQTAPNVISLARNGNFGQEGRVQNNVASSSNHHQVPYAVDHNHNLDEAWGNVSSSSSRQGIAMSHHYPQQMQHPHQMQHHQQMQHPHQMHLQMQMSQMQMQQQMQMNAMRQQEAMKRIQSSEKTSTDVGLVDDTSHKFEEAWHEGLDREYQSEIDQYQEALESSGQHEGKAGIEELAQAWAEAQDDTDWREQYENNTVAPYEFQDATNNPLPKESNLDPFSQGMRYFNGGDTKNAILCFESELRTRPDNADAWKMLGKCHAENDDDPKAIACLERAVERDPYSLESLLALGVSYVNELDHTRALRNLKSWVENNPKYAGMEIREDGYGTGTQMDTVQNLMLQALEWDPTDAGAHEALGVCYNVSRDYDAAVDSIQRAITHRPQDYQLWNKLGATLANSNRSEEALPAYHKALELKPKYARAWLNMAISHSNLRGFNEAARCYLQTLALNPNASHCWNYLRIALSCDERWDLLPLVAGQDLAAFRDYFDFVNP